VSGEIGGAVRRLVAERASFRCEYCLIHEEDSYHSHHIDHVISRKHGGDSSAENLAYACLRCNAWKGTDIGSLDVRSGRFVGLFNPRRQRWSDHFVLRGAVIEPLSSEGEATSRLLKLNLAPRVAERWVLVKLGRYPR